MKPTLTALAILVLCSSSFAGGKRCAVGESSIPTPGLRELARGNSDVRLTDAQVETLFDADQAALRTVREARKLVEGLEATGSALEADAPLSDIVVASLFPEFRECAWVVDPETSDVFYFARKDAILKMKDGTDRKLQACPICVAVRKAMEEPFAYPELAASEVVRKAAAMRQSARESWTKALRDTLDEKQRRALAESQERHLVKRTGELAEAGLRKFAKASCASCKDQVYILKCEFCLQVENAVKRVSE